MTKTRTMRNSRPGLTIKTLAQTCWKISPPTCHLQTDAICRHEWRSNTNRLSSSCRRGDNALAKWFQAVPCSSSAMNYFQQVKFPAWHTPHRVSNLKKLGKNPCGYQRCHCCHPVPLSHLASFGWGLRNVNRHLHVDDFCCWSSRDLFSLGRPPGQVACPVGASN